MRLLACLAIVSAALLPTLPAAQTKEPADPVAERIKAELKKKLPEAPVDSVRKAGYGNLYEVVAGGEIIYTDDKTTFLLVGPIVDLKTKENVTESRLRVVNAVKFETLPLESAIKIVRGNGSRKVAMFADPNCGYCKRFERDLLAVNDVTVYLFLYPILSPDSTEKSKRVWCSADPSKAWLDWMTKDVQPAGEGKCNTAAIDKSLAFGRDKGIRGTPTIFFESGERVPGVIPIPEFEKRLAAKVASR
jgi:thiol:disulfide interchange protein DsbC